MPEIVVKFEDKIVERVVTEKKRITIGRTQDNDIILNNRGVSRKHAQIEFNPSGAVIIDNESLNGTFVNNRKITEEFLKDNDLITIGKFNLTYRQSISKDPRLSDMDGTMVMQTRKHKDLLSKDRKEQEITQKVGCSVLLGELNVDRKECPLDKEVITLGKGTFVNIRARGFFLPKLQAKIVKENDEYLLVSLGRKGMTQVNGEEVQRHRLKNDDLIQIGKSVFRFIQRKS
ncbi:MAG: FHA domain-containing protein [candidate division Zixibacteria bacterium]|nr:FHA domain-containing protein [candidate division Zixibacteria bacterium]